MGGVDWGGLYGRLQDETLDPDVLEAEVSRLMADEDVQRQSGIYPYVLTGEERHLNIRKFSDAMRQAAFERQNGVCGACGKTFGIGEMEADHVTPWSQGGATTAANCQMLCRGCNRRKGSK